MPVRTFFQELLHAFSAKRNFNSLFCLENINTDLKCLNGIRFLTMSWIILGHTSVWIHYQAFSHSFNIIDVVKPFSSQALFNVTLSVDTFFLISGLLTSYATWKTTDGVYKKFNTLWFILSRYARLTPCLAVAMCLTLFLPLMGSGPIWHEFIDPIAKRCEQNWWINLIYMQAFIKSEEICLLPTWWLSNDMLFHVISLFILIPLMRVKKFGIAVNGLLIVIFTVLTAVKSYQNNYLPAILATHPQVEEYWLDFVVQYFWKPYLHGPSFFIGLHLGYLLARKQYPKVTKVTSVIGWTIALLMMFVVLHATYPLTLGEIWPTWANVLFDCTNRMVWSFALSWIIYASASGHGGLIGKFLGLPVFGPLAKITYAVYLTHMLLIWAYMGSRRELSYTSAYTGIYMYIAHWTLAQGLGVFVALFFESPFLNIQKLMVKRFDSREDAIKLGFLTKEEKREEESQELTPF